MGPRRGGSSQYDKKLDSDVLAIIQTTIDNNDIDHPRDLPISLVLNKIQRSNSSLSRKRKDQLEPAIERVLAQLTKDADADGSSDLGSIQGEFDGIEVSESKSAQHMNNQLTRAWKTEPAAAIREASAQPREMPKEEKEKEKKRAADGERSGKRRKLAAEVDRSPPTHTRLKDFGGAREVVKQLVQLMYQPLLHPLMYVKNGQQPPRGVLLHGPPGCGKTMLANAMAAELKIPFISISAPSIVSGMSGESEKALRDHFEEARKIAPCIIFIDEIDAITPKRESAQREMEKRIVAQLLTCMDDLTIEKTGGKAVMVLAATNRPDSLDPALRRGGRFDKEINMTVPSEPAREQILRVMTRGQNIAEDVDFKKLAKSTPGFVGADLKDLTSTTFELANHRVFEVMMAEAQARDADMDIDTVLDVIDVDERERFELDTYLRQQEKQGRESGLEKVVSITMTNADFLAALPMIQPSAKREGFATIPETTWEDIGALTDIRQRLTETIINPIKHPEAYKLVGLTEPTGVLLWGPPGCGKTLLARAVANESQANFISIKGPELLNKFVGESEKAVRQVFSRARSSIPCVIFFDELDALVPKRDDALSESSSRVVNTLLTELDGMSDREGIYVIGATNRPDVIDPAMLRPGRLSDSLFVDLPEEEDRVAILRTLARKTKMNGSAELVAIAKGCNGFSGADLGNLINQARLEALRRDASGVSGVELADFEIARTKVDPSVTDRKMYQRLRRNWSKGA
jgi:ribosome biogenesis ATPase